MANVKGHDYYKDAFVPPEEVVTEIDPRDKVRAFRCFGSEVFCGTESVTC